MWGCHGCGTKGILTPNGAELVLGEHFGAGLVLLSIASGVALSLTICAHPRPHAGSPRVPPAALGTRRRSKTLHPWVPFPPRQ